MGFLATTLAAFIGCFAALVLWGSIVRLKPVQASQNPRDVRRDE